MIRHKNRVIEDYSICPLTGDIFDKDGVVQKTRMNNGRSVFKDMSVHQIVAHTFYGWRPDKVVHHRDGNPLNNMLSNLDYTMTQAEHCSLENTGKEVSEKARARMSAAQLGKTHTEETKAKISAAHMCKDIGTKWWNNGKENRHCKECPGCGWKRGMIRK